ncbi:MAG TPA: hypothetical protein VMX36_01435 [Sedimentisphaerales bacterium]|nr:hypothetical protein [Sedimentisphaerales bacterium]
MSSALKKLRHRSPSLSKRAEAPVLIVRPYHPEGLTSEETHDFLSFCFASRIADISGRKSKVPEIARNIYIDEFLHSKEHAHKTHIFFLDDDSPPLENEAIIKLLRHGKPVVCAPTPICRYLHYLQQIAFYWNTQGLTDEHTEDNPQFEIYQVGELPKRLFKCYRTGGTGLLVQRNVLERLKPPYQMTTYNETWTGVVKSEDTYFSDLIRKAGFEIWADGNTVCHHYHRLDILDMVAVMMSLLHEKSMKEDPLHAKIVMQKLKNIVDSNEEMERIVNNGN